MARRVKRRSMPSLPSVAVHERGVAAVSGGSACREVGHDEFACPAHAGARPSSDPRKTGRSTQLNGAAGREHGPRDWFRARLRPGPTGVLRGDRATTEMVRRYGLNGLRAGRSADRPCRTGTTGRRPSPPPCARVGWPQPPHPKGATNGECFRAYMRDTPSTVSLSPSRSPTSAALSNR